MKTHTRTKRKRQSRKSTDSQECKIIAFPRTPRQMAEAYCLGKSGGEDHILRRMDLSLRELEICSEIGRRHGLDVVDVIEGLIRSLFKAYADGPSASWGGGVIGDCLPRLLRVAVEVRLNSGSDYWPPQFYLKQSHEA